MKKVSPDIQKTAIALLNQGQSVKRVAAQLNIGVATVSRLRTQFLAHLKKQPSGRPGILSKTDKHAITRKLLSGNLKTGKETLKYLQGVGVPISYSCVLDNLQKLGFKSKKKAKKPHLTAKQKAARYKWAKAHANWTVDDWKRVIFSDETKINLWNSDGIRYCWIRNGQELQPFHLEPTVKHGGGSLMFWGCMTWRGLGYGCQIYDGTMKKHDYIQILDTTFKDTLGHYKYYLDDFIFQHDNDPKHTAKATRMYLEESGIDVLPWPAQSADLNPIEHVWNYLKVQIGARERRPTSIHELWNVVLEEWEKVPLDFIRKLIESMPRRVAAVLKAKGGQTKY